METELSVNIYKSGDIPVLDLSGDLDTYTCPKLREAILNLLNQGESRVIIRMTNVRYIDSSGLGTLVGGLRRVSEQKGKLVISEPNEQIRKVLNITGLIKVFSTYNNDAEAALSMEH